MSVNKKAVRKEVEQMKNKFDQLSRDGKLSPETKVLIESQFTLFLEKATKKDNENSSKLSSQTVIFSAKQKA